MTAAALERYNVAEEAGEDDVTERARNSAGRVRDIPQRAPNTLEP